MRLNLLNYPANQQVLSLLDWPIIESQLLSISHFELTANLIFPKNHLFTIGQDLDLLESFIDRFDFFQDLFEKSVRKIPSPLTHFNLFSDLSKDKYFNTQELNFFAIFLEELIHSYKQFDLPLIQKNYPFDQKQQLHLKEQFIKPLRLFIDQSGTPHYENHPLLKKINDNILRIEHTIRSEISLLLNSSQYKEKIQISTFDIINDRYVIPIKADSYHHSLGSIISRSQSGMTLFIEPPQIIKYSSERLGLLSELEAETLRLTKELSIALHKYSSEILPLKFWPIEIDWLYTKATFSLQHQLSKPTIDLNSTEFELIGVFHPLIKNPIVNNLKIKSSEQGLVISGPNTGGKTVILKCMGLTVLFMQIGLYVPAKYAKLPQFDGLFYFSHDHQDLSAGFSSFHSEVKYYLELFDYLKLNPYTKNLILIDEIFNSTSSEEASALAIGFLEELFLLKNSITGISTHHQMLKTYMHQNVNFISAHMGFDPLNHKPTYKLITGSPGSSFAFSIFEMITNHNKKYQAITKRAEELLNQKEITYEKLLQKVSAQKTRLDEEMLEYKKLNQHLKNQKAAMEGSLRLEKEKLFSSYENDLNKILKKSEDFFEQVKQNKILSKKSLTTESAKIHSELKVHDIHYKPLLLNSSHESKIDYIHLGKYVWAESINKTVLIQKINTRKGEVQVSYDGKSIWLPFSQISLSKKVQVKPKQISINIEKPSDENRIEIDGRGMRLENFQKLVLSSIQNIYSGDIPFCNVIHGHGDGILKNWLRDYLRKECKDLKFENLEGNDGCTKIFN